jgi:hypothetical protein
MGRIFTLLTVRGAIIMVPIISASVMALATIPSNQPAFNLFAPYADIMPGQPRDAVSRRGFECQFTPVPSLGEFCSLAREIGGFSDIKVWIAQDGGLVRKVDFRLHVRTLTLGDLVLLWGKPEIAIYAQTVNFRWANAHVTAIPQAYPGHLSYWLPITYVTFESVD